MKRAATFLACALLLTGFAGALLTLDIWVPKLTAGMAESVAASAEAPPPAEEQASYIITVENSHTQFRVERIYVPATNTCYLVYSVGAGRTVDTTLCNDTFIARANVGRAIR